MRWTALLLMLGCALTARASETAITYQGQLQQDGVPYNGTPDMQFRLWSDLTAGFVIPPTNAVSQVPVQDGLFQVVLDFGDAFARFPQLYLEVTVDGVPLAPRQLVTAAPRALEAAGWRRTLDGTTSTDGRVSIRSLSSTNALHVNGSVGINTHEPARDLHVKQVGTDGNAVGIELESAAGNAWGLYVAISDNLGFRYNGALVARINAADGQFVSLSDRRFKRDIEPLTGVLDRVLQLSPSAYAMQGAAPDGPRTFGLIAQDVQRLFPEAVSVQDGVYGVSYGQVSVLNTAAIIELEARYRASQSASNARIARLEADNATLRARLVQAGRRLDDAAHRLEARLAVLERGSVSSDRIVER